MSWYFEGYRVRRYNDGRRTGTCREATELELQQRDEIRRLEEENEELKERMQVLEREYLRYLKALKEIASHEKQGYTVSDHLIDLAAKTLKEVE